MPDISTNKVVRVIFLAREYGPESHQLHDYISGLNEDEAANLVAIMPRTGTRRFRPRGPKRPHPPRITSPASRNSPTTSKPDSRRSASM